MKKNIFVILVIVLILCLSNYIHGAIPALERAALIALYNSTNGDSWTNNSGWKTPPLDTDGFAMPGTEGGWYGITVLADSVTQINMYNNFLTGSIPPELGNLAYLNKLLAANNQLSGSIPAELGNLSNLIELRLSINQLSGSIPSQLGNLGSIDLLYLNGNQLTGNIPSQIGNLTSVRYFHLENNQLSGSIPAELGNLSNLVEIRFNNNQLSGTIPTELYSSDMRGIDLSNNQLSGSIPAELGSMNALIALLLNNNQLSGSIPAELGNLSNLIDLRLNNNQLSGDIPGSLADLTSIIALEIGNNCLSATDPTLITWLNNHDPDWESTQTNCGPASTITVTSPNDGENWLVGSTHDITWTSSGPVGNVKIEYSPDNGSNWTEITANTENDGIYSWTLPNTSSANYLVRVSETDGDPTDTSDGVFTLFEGISGRVADEGGNGIQNVRVRLYDTNNLQVKNTPTDANGDYILLGIVPGNYRIRFDTANANVNFVGEYYNDKVSLVYADVLTITAGQALTANAVLSPGGIITGQVTDTNENGISKVQIIVRGAFSNLNFSANKYTDDSGNYIVQGLPAGAYKVFFNTDGTQNSYIPEWYNNKEDFLTADILTLIPGQTISDVHAVLASGGTISGRITDASTGDPIPEIEIYALDMNKNVTGCYAFTDENGDYALKGLPTGNFKINFNSYSYNLYYGGNYNDQWHNNKTTFQSADAVAITAGQIITGMNAALTSNGGIIRGRVTNENGDGIANVDIWVTTELGEFSVWEAFTDADGYYQVSGIPTGAYHVLFITNTAQGNYLDEAFDNVVMTGSPTLEADWVNVTEGHIVESVNAVLSVGGYVSGHVTDQNGNPLRNIRVRLYEASSGNMFVRHSALTDFFGNYTISRVRPVQLKAYFQSYEMAGGDYKAEYYNDKTTLATGDAFTVIATETRTGIDAVLASGGGTISGYVRDKNGAGLKNAAVQLYDKNGARSFLGQASCNVNGYFELKGVIPGEYKFYISCNNYITPEWYNNKANHAQADLVTVSEGENTLVEITLGEDSSLTIVSPNGGEIWNVGSSHPITWTNTGPVDSVRIEYSIDNGASWIEIVSSTENTGIYNWVVPIGAAPSVNCIVRISEAGDSSPSDVSDAVFTIFANPANWIPVEGLQNNMVVYGKANNGNNVALTGDWLGAFGPGGVTDCRGTTAIGANGNYYLTIGSNATSAETITFKLWPYPTGPALDADETVEFVADSIYGGLPLHFGARTQVVSLVSGWNWVGFNTLPPDTLLNSIFSVLAGKVAQVKTQTQAAVYSGGVWIGDLSNMSGIADGAMYKINATQACILSLNGVTVSFNKPLSMVTGWNWAAYLPVLPQNIDVALNTIMPLLIQAKSQTQSTVKLGDGLIGDLIRMEPTKGYTIQVSAPGVLVYPHGESSYPDQSTDAATQSKVSGTTSVPWKTIQGNQYNMVSYGKVFFEGKAVTTPGYYLVSVGSKGEGDCRAVSPVGTDGNYFSTVLGNANGDALKFKLYNSTTHKTYDVVESQVFKSDALKADYNFRARSIRITAPAGDEKLNMGSICSIAWEAYEVSNIKIELYKNGKSLSVIAALVPAGSHTYSWTIPFRMRAGNNYQIKISAADASVMAEDTSNSFSIVPLTVITLNYPVGAEVWQVKRSYDITWGCSGIDNIKIELYKGAVLNTVISESTLAAAGKYTWTVPANQTLARDYKIKISSIDAGVNLSDTGKSAFSIVAYKNTFADFDGDGKADLVWRYYGTGGYNCIWLSGVGQGSDPVDDARLAPQAVTILDETNLDYQLKGTGDFNNDGKEDLLWRDKVTGTNSIWTMNGTTFAGTVQLPAETTMSWDICGTGDFNNDGKVDILWRNRTNGSNKVWLMNGIERTSEVSLSTEANLNWNIAGAGDFNSDGKADILWRNTMDGSDRIWIMNGTTLVRTEQLSAVNVDWEIAGVGDYDGNGKPDIFWRHKVDGRDTVWIMDGLARAESLNLTRVTNNDWKIEN